MSKTATDAIASTKVVTTKVRFSYLHVFEPTAMEDGQEKKYSVSLIIPKSEKGLIAQIRKAIAAATEQGIASKWGGKKPSKMDDPLRDGDVEKPEDDAYANSYFVSAKCKTKPGVVDKDLNPILSQDEIKSGDYGRASINFYAFNAGGNKGVACGLNNIQKLADGDALSGRSSAADDFGDGEQEDFTEEDDLLS